MMTKNQYDFELVSEKLSCLDYASALQNTLPYATAGDSNAQCVMDFFTRWSWEFREI